MKKSILGFFLSALFVSVCFLVVSCGDDDDLWDCSCTAVCDSRALSVSFDTCEAEGDLEDVLAIATNNCNVRLALGYNCSVSNCSCFCFEDSEYCYD